MGFVKSNTLIIDSDIPPISLYLYQTTTPAHYIPSITPGAKTYALMMPEGTYNLLAMEEDDNSNCYVIFRKNINTAGLNYITLNHNEAVFSTFPNLDQIRDINDNPVSALDDCSLDVTIAVKRAFQSEYYSTTVFDFLTTPQLGRLFMSPIEDSLVIVEQNLRTFQGNQFLSLTTYSPNGIKAQSDLNLLSGSQNLKDIHIKFSYENPVFPIRKETTIDYNILVSDVGGGIWNNYRWLLGGSRYAHVMTNKNPLVFNPLSFTSLRPAIYEFNDANKVPFFEKVSKPQFRVNKNGEYVFFEKLLYRPDSLEYFDVQTLQSGDTLVVEEQGDIGIQLPVFQFEVRNTNLVLRHRTDEFDFDDGGVISSNGTHQQMYAFLDTINRNFTAQMFTHNRPLQSADLTSPLQPYPSAFYPYYQYAVNINKDRYHLLAYAPQYNLLGQSGQTTIDYEFNVTPTNIPVFLPSLDFFQILGDGKLTEELHPGQDGKVRLVIFDPKQNVDSVGISLLKNDGTEISLAVAHSSKKEYFASIPRDIPSGFLDVIVRVHNGDGNTFTLTVSPAFYYGPSMDGVQFDARLLLSTYTLENLSSVKFNAGDTLGYTLSYTNYGNSTAKNISIHFPQTDYFNAIGNTTISVDSARPGDTCKVPLALVFLGKKQPNDLRTYYMPSISWNSHGRLFSREYSIPVDFSSAVTGITESGNDVPKDYSLFQNYPNPFNPTTTISFNLPSRVFVSLKVFDLLGREVATIVSEELAAGTHSLQWNTASLSSGVYFYRLQARDYTATKKLLLLK
jgi:hypothetical protein